MHRDSGEVHTLAQGCTDLEDVVCIQECSVPGLAGSVNWLHARAVPKTPSSMEIRCVNAGGIAPGTLDAFNGSLPVPVC